MVDNTMSGGLARSPVTFNPPEASLEKRSSTDPSSTVHEGPSKADHPVVPRDLPQPPTKPAMLSSPSPGAIMPPSRSGTLSWQQRPTSRGLTGPRARPLSQIAAENRTSRSPRSSEEPPSISELGMSRDQIAESLSSKDPTWFRQTHERGQGSAAYRRNQDESASDTASLTTSMPLPGMSRDSNVEPERQASPASESIRSISPSRTDSIRGGSTRQSKNSPTTSVSSANGIRPLLPIFTEHSFEPLAVDPSSQGKDLQLIKGLAMSPSQGRISPERLDRPSSPTKGLGGFVQSAMLKRSDSVNKRWSAQPGPGLSRGNSIASNRGGFEAPKYGIPTLNGPRDQVFGTPSREVSPIANSRPGSSHSTAAAVMLGKESHEARHEPPPSAFVEPTVEAPSVKDEFVEPVHSRKTSPTDVAKPKEDTNAHPITRISPPSSPSKRWSPTKSSWLENAINKPDSPKPKMPPPQQPSWMTSINQAKQQRGSVDLAKGNTFKEVSTGGLLRSPPMGAASKSSSMSGLPAGFSAAAIHKRRTEDDERIKKSEERTDMENHEASGDPSNEEQLNVRKAEVSALPTVTEPEPTTGAPLRLTKSTPAAAVRDKTSEIAKSPKTKPETPPKKDFRSNLKPRQVSGEKKTSEDAEFKNVFGKLKRTQTQNYVAPDELKDNILRGKAGLAVTGGPKKTERRDEFKESLVKQKEAMKTGPPPSVGRKPSAGEIAKNRAPSIPEALTNRNVLAKPKSSTNGTNGTNEDSAERRQQPEALVKFSRLKEKSQPALSGGPQQSYAKSQETSSVNSKLGSDFNSSLAGILSRGPPVNSDQSSANPILLDASADSKALSAKAPQQTTEGPQLTHMTKSRARGPKRRLPNLPGAGEVTGKPGNPGSNSTSSNPNGAQPRVETKPTAESPSTVKDTFQQRPLTSISNNHRKPSQPQPPRKPSSNFNKPEIHSPLPPPTKPISLKSTSPRSKSPPSTKPKPSSPALERSQNLSTSTPTSKPPSRTNPEQVQEEKTNVLSTRPVDEVHPIPQAVSPLPLVKEAAASWNQSEASGRHLPPRARSPIKLPTRKDEEAAMKDAGLLPRNEAPIGLGLNDVAQTPQSATPANHNLPTPLASPKSPPLPAKKPPAIANHKNTNTENNGLPSIVNGSSTPQSSEAARIFAELFDDSPITDLKVNIDTPAVLSARASTVENDKIRTLRKQIWEVSSGGKLISVPSDQSHILFEDSLYICHHVFGSPSGTRTTEVYLWCGDGVATSAIEDAQIFARKEAKDHGGKLIVLHQGKESSNFFQALGGIVITRHGQSDRAPSKYMLCGRRFVGQIAFDEVDFSPRSLCSGFPYLVSSGTGKIHLWKGIGSGIDELGCARLIGMDLGSGGEIHEVEDGKEPDAFWNLFPNNNNNGGGQQSPPNISSPKHWHLKPSCEQYATRLYRIDVEAPRPKSSSGFRWGRRGSAPASTPTDEGAAAAAKWNAAIKEILPFAQSDVFNDGVFVLDTFFEVFVYVFSFLPLL